MMNLLKHLRTITKHKIIVMRLCFRCGLYKQGLLHDMSKYSIIELAAGVKYYQGNRSPNGLQRELIGYSSAWLHHKGRNKHHWEYWVDFNRYGTVPSKMPIKYVVEMFCDRVAATMIYNKDYDNKAPLDYYNATRFYYIIEDSTDEILKDMLMFLANNNLDKTIKYIKEKYLNK